MKGTFLLLITGLIAGAFIVWLGLNYQNVIIISFGSIIFISSPVPLFVKTITEAHKR